MSVRIIGPHPLANDTAGRPVSPIATVFPEHNAIVTLPGIHATQRLEFFEILNRERQRCGQRSLTRKQEERLSDGTVDVVREDDFLLIRPDPKNMTAALAGDEILQRVVPKWQIRFLHIRDPVVRKAIKRRGECWRTAPEPTSAKDMERRIIASRKSIGHDPIYYYSRATGTHLITFQEYSRLQKLDDESLRVHLIEIQIYARRSNRLGYPEVGFFAGSSQLEEEFRRHDFAAMDTATLRKIYQDLQKLYYRSVLPDLREDNATNPAWRCGMYSELAAPREAPVPEETLLGLSPEFVMQVKWLPGGRVEGEDLVWDSVFEQATTPEASRICDPLVTGFLLNLFREYEDLEYVNFGRVVQSLSWRSNAPGRRGVYIAEIKRRCEPEEFVKVIRLQKWGIAERLDDDKELFQAIAEAEEYTEYILDRRLGCRQLGMQLPRHLSAKKLAEIYSGKQSTYRGTPIRTAYFERDYVRGIATDKIPTARFADSGFATTFARLLGQAAATNMIVGRCDTSIRPLFDDGDEILVEDADRMPKDIVVADHTGAFADFETPLTAWADEYAQPLIKRADNVPDFETFATAYLDAYVATFRRTQEDYRRRQRGFDTLFIYRPRQETGSFPYRWKKILQRLKTTDPSDLEQAVRSALMAKST